MKGAPEVVLPRCAEVVDEGGERRPLTREERERLVEHHEKMAKDGLRVIALAYRERASHREAREEESLVFVGLVGMIDPPREGAAAAVAMCRKVGIKPIMITGDHRLTALAVARSLGMYQEGDRVLTGEELHQMSPEELEGVVDEVTVYARVLPLDKLTIVRAWKKRGEVVAMTGDGVNDAPALRHADIGVAMGIRGTEVTREAADMVLLDDNFATIVEAIMLGRWIYDNIKKYLTYLLRCNLTEVAVIGGVTLLLGPDFLPMLPAAVLYVNLATDGLPALALGVAPPDPDIMARPPRSPKESIFSREVVVFIAFAFCCEIPCFFALFFHDLTDLRVARTEVFLLFIVTEIIIALNLRSMRFSIITAPPHGWLVAASLWEVLLIAGLMHIPAVRQTFGVTMPSLAQLGVIVAFGVVVWCSMELVKWWVRRSCYRLPPALVLPGSAKRSA